MHKGLSDILTGVVEELSSPDSYGKLYHEYNEGDILPNWEVLKQVMELVRSIVFPGYYGNPSVDRRTLKYHIGVATEELAKLLYTQVQKDEVVEEFIAYLPELRRVLATDVVAAFNGDPAAKNYGEIISCYPIIKTLTNYRVAHELLKLGVELIPRILTEMAHSETGIDIHPGAQIGEYFTIDHGTGVVIGETCIIGKNVKLYQGVTLGAKSFPLDEDGNPIKGIPRHPILEDDVIVYSNASILGRITIGKGATIGGNIWVTQDVPAGAFIAQKR